MLAIARQLPKHVTLVIDDYHFETSVRSDLALANLARTTHHLRIIVIGRRVEILNSTVVTARTRITALGPADLSLTADESADLAARLGIPMDEQLTAALRKAGGWPLAIRAALDLGNGAQYVDTPDGQKWTAGASQPLFNPMANLEAFARGALSLVESGARQIMLAAAELDAVTLPLGRHLLRCDEHSAQNALRHLTELGLLVPVQAEFGPEYHCHPSIRSALALLASSWLADGSRRRAYIGRAAEVVVQSPLRAFRLLCAAGDLAAAETVLAANFSRILDDADRTLALLRPLSEAALVAYPTFTAALLALENPRPEVPASRLCYLVRLWRRGLDARLPQGPATPFGSLQVATIGQAMVASRVSGELENARAYMSALERSLTPHNTDPAMTGTSFDEARHMTPQLRQTSDDELAIFYLEIAATSLSLGDTRRARRTLTQLRTSLS
ncbi:hypothetical protein, partial [Leucobacter komagatae]|uniref:hypothetical protein n=1 Tax=Leucobacter komagatae TaxID=55969 RepID=UPI0012ED7BA5